MNRLYLFTTNKCNQRCRFCIRHRNDRPVVPEETPAELERQISSFPKDGLLIFDGGEPLMSPDFLRLLALAEEKGIENISVLTNGMMLDDEGFAGKIGSASRKVSFSVSLHSHLPDVSDSITKCPGGFQRTVKGIRNILAKGHRVSIYHVITSLNYDHLPEFVEFLHKDFPEIANVTLSYLYIGGMVLDDPKIIPKLSEVRPYAYRALRFLREKRYVYNFTTCGVIPLCMLEGYEGDIIGQLRRDTKETMLFDFKGLQRYKLGRKEFHDETKTKSDECGLCAYESICPGLWSKYAEIFGTGELHHVAYDPERHEKLVIGRKNISSEIEKAKGREQVFFTEFTEPDPGWQESALKKLDDAGIMHVTEKTRVTGPYAYVGPGCNNSCVFCSEADMKPAAKTTAQVKAEVSAIRKRYDFINFMGKEPTLRKDLPELLRFASGLGFRQVGITTNGRMFSYRSYAREILSSGIGQVVVTLLSSSEKEHDLLTLSKGSFIQTVAGIRNIIAEMPRGFSLLANILVCGKNYKGVMDTADFLYGLGVREINLLNVSPLSARSKTKAIIPRMTDAVPYLAKVIEKYDRISGVKILLVEYPPCVLPKEYRERFFPCLEENSQKVRIPLCSSCAFSDRCSGILRDYIGLYGMEEFGVENGR